MVGIREGHDEKSVCYLAIPYHKEDVVEGRLHFGAHKIDTKHNHTQPNTTQHNQQDSSAICNIRIASCLSCFAFYTHGMESVGLRFLDRLLALFDLVAGFESFKLVAIPWVLIPGSQRGWLEGMAGGGFQSHA
jgi:hypothetical protein